VGVAGAVDVGIVAVRGLVLDVRRRDRDAARLLFRRLVDLVVGRERRAARLRQNLRDRRRQRRLAVVNVTNRANVAMRLRAVEFLFCHSSPLLAAHPGGSKSAAGYCGKRPCSSQKFWANLASPCREASYLGRQTKRTIGRDIMTVQTATRQTSSPQTPPLPQAKPEKLGLSSLRLQKMSDAFKRETDKGTVPGVTIMVARRGQVGWFDAIGRQNPAGSAPMAHDSIFRIFSMTKPIVSVGIMMLVEDGQI